jgi:hypothetical protein
MKRENEFIIKIQSYGEEEKNKITLSMCFYCW